MPVIYQPFSRVEPELKEALRTAVAREHRSIANMVEVLIRDYCELKGISIRELDTEFSNQANEQV